MSKWLLGLMALILLCALFVGQVPASEQGKTLRYTGGGEGMVVFDGRIHAGKGLVCKDCHMGLFATRKKALIATADHEKGTQCFACHDGAKASRECVSCHRKR
jgi:phosphate transport system substrate-binding protein